MREGTRIIENAGTYFFSHAAGRSNRTVPTWNTPPQPRMIIVARVSQRNPLRLSLAFFEAAYRSNPIVTTPRYDARSPTEPP